MAKSTKRKEPEDHSEAARPGAVQNRCSKQPWVPEFAKILRPCHPGFHSLLLLRTPFSMQQHRCDPVPDLAETAAVRSGDNQPAFGCGTPTGVKSVRLWPPEP